MSARRSLKARYLGLMMVLGLVMAACAAEDEPAPDEEPAATEDPAEDGAEEPAEAPAEDPAEEDEQIDEVSLAGETIEFIVPYNPGGGYDNYVRMMIPYLEDILDANFVVTNEVGAGAVLATNNTAAADPDDLRIQIVDVVGSVANQLGEIEGVRFDLGEFTWIGTIQGESRIVIGAPDSEFASWEDILAGDPLFGMAGPGAHTFTTYSVLREVFDLPVERVSGLEGTGPTLTALLRGDIDAAIRSVSAAIEEIESGEVQGYVVVGRERDENLPDIPHVYEFDMVGNVDLLDAHVGLFEVSRAIAAPPGMDPSVRDLLRDAVWETLNDPDFLAEAEQQQLPIEALNGADTADRMDAALRDAPPEYAELIRQGFEDFEAEN